MRPEVPAAIGRPSEKGNCDAPLGIVALTVRGSATALRLARGIPNSTAYLPERFLQTAGAPEDCETIPYSGKVSALVATLFARSRAIVLVMATGAAVRLIAGHLADKHTDPAVVVVDDGGRFAISLISGHLGGANELATRIASTLGAQAVITTASEGAGVPAADLIGAQMDWRTEPGGNLKRVASALVNGERVGFYQDAGSAGWAGVNPPSHLVRFQTVAELAAADPAAAIVISDRILPLPAHLAQRTAVYRPPVLVLGVGCSRGAEEAELATLVANTLHLAGLSPLSVRAIATIDLKANEAGLCAFSSKCGWPIVTYTAAELDAAPGNWTRSAVVWRAVGTAGVAEPAALLAARATSLIVPKRKTEHVTVAVARTLVDEAAAIVTCLNEDADG